MSQERNTTMSPFEIIIIKTVYMYSIYLLIHINCIYIYVYIYTAIDLTWNEGFLNFIPFALC